MNASSVDDWLVLRDFIKETAAEVHPVLKVKGWGGKQKDDLSGYSAFTFFIESESPRVWDFAIKLHEGYLQLRGVDIVDMYHEIPLSDPELKSKLKECLEKCLNKELWKVYGPGIQVLI